MFSREFYLAAIKNFIPAYTHVHFLRLKNLDVPVEDFSKFFNLPRDWQQVAQAWFEKQAKTSSVLHMGAFNYPKGLLSLENPPMFLFFHGDLGCLNRRSVAIVGARETFRETQVWIEKELQEGLRQQELTVVSGGARGIDQAAHFMALRMNLPTCVVLPSALDRPYPELWIQWKDEVLARGGLILSEYPANTEMRKYHFLRRNELLAAITAGCFVVQASRRSGTLLTARWVQQLGRSLSALCHFPHSKTMGSLDLISEGATLIRDGRDLHVWLESLPTGFF
ncbi:MAG: DNA-protecting protein DprA [Bdellovibrionales bacterium]|nr:DNA-protecting protein DprA [Bdellovibrionales bacterium]